MPANLSLSIPRPCAQPWAAMTPTAAGRHCGACATEVMDFTRLSDAEILAVLSQRGGRTVCVLAHTAQLVPAPATRWRRWLLAGLALAGWHPLASCAGKPPQLPPAQAAAAPNPAAAQPQQLIIRGQVFDGPSGPAVAGVRVLINATQYGTVTDADGKFELRLARDWAPVAAGPLTLHFFGNPFDFQEQVLPLDARTAAPKPLVVRLASVPNRGQVMGRLQMPEPPVKPPER